MPVHDASIRSRLLPPARRGTILVIVAGLSALLLSLSMAFLARMRSDAEVSNLVMRETQAHIMLQAACSYIREASRLGYSATNREAYGWVDVRDGRLGPKLDDKTGDDAGFFPIGSVARCPMFVMNRPPYAVQLTMAYNPIDTDIANADFGLPLERNPDPQPVVDNGWDHGMGTINASNLCTFDKGDPTPRSDSVNLAWFRVMRISGTRFLVTCGSGASDGFRDWNEVVAAGQTGEFDHDPVLFSDIVTQETRLRYLVEWSAGVCIANETYRPGPWQAQTDQYQLWPLDSSHSDAKRSQAISKNMAGTISWIQRLSMSPAAY